MSLEIYTTVSRMNVFGAEFDYEGGVKQSVGGVPSPDPMPPIQAPLPVGNTLSYYLFPDVLPDQRVSGSTTYRALMIKNSSNVVLPSLRLVVRQPQSSAQIAISATVADTMPRLNSETQDPGVVFSTDVTVGPIPANQYAAVWFRRTVPAACPAWSQDYWGIEATPFTGGAIGVLFFQNLLSGTLVSRVASTNRTSGLKLGGSEVFTISCVDRFGAEKDPAQNRVRVILSKPSNPTVSGDFPESITEMDMATRVGMGVYSYTFRPTVAGFFTLRFDIGDSEWVVTRNVRP